MFDLGGGEVNLYNVCGFNAKLLLICFLHFFFAETKIGETWKLVFVSPRNIFVAKQLNFHNFCKLSSCDFRILWFQFFFFWFKRFPDWGPEQRESNLTVLCPHIIIILIRYIIIKLLMMENHPSRNREQNSFSFVFEFERCRKAILKPLTKICDR